MQQNYDLPEKFYVTWLHHSVPHYVESWIEIKIILISFCTIYIYIYSWLRHYSTSRKVAGSILEEVIAFSQLAYSHYSHYGTGVDPASNRNEYQEFFRRGGKRGRRIRLKTSAPPLRRLYMKVWDPRLPITWQASTACYKNSFTLLRGLDLARLRASSKFTFTERKLRNLILRASLSIFFSPRFDGLGCPALFPVRINLKATKFTVGKTSRTSDGPISMLLPT
jgi:hypothetical protein